LDQNHGIQLVTSHDLYHSLTEKQVFAEAATHSGISSGVIKAAWDAAGEVIRTWATEGHSVPLPGLGTMRFGVRSKAVAELEDVKTGLITVRRIIFTPNTEVKDELKNTSIQITCLDEDGNVLKRVTSGDSGDIEDNENGSNGNGGGDTPGGGDDDNGGNGGSQSEPPAAPTISGKTSFSDSTTVSLSGPDGADIYYTLDGSTPTSESTMYTEEFGLSDTTTVKSIAILNGVSSEVASKTFTKNS
jgi:predicted histone-like DNA-binding protein